MDRKILFVAAGAVQSTAMNYAKEIGYKIYAIDASPDAVGFQVADDYNVCDICNPAEIIKAAKKYQVNAIMSMCTDAPLVAVAKACAELNLPSLSVESAMMATNKWLQRNAMKKVGLVVPEYQKFQSVEEAKKIAAFFPLPAVIKPTDSAGSRGVTYVEKLDDVAIAADSALKNSRSRVGMIENFMVGPEISVEAFVLDDRFIPLCLSEKVRTQPPYLLDREVHFPQNFSEDETNKILAIAEEAVKACGLNNCPIHMELIRTVRGPIVVEVAARGAGFYVFTKIIPYVTGVDTISCCLDLAFGKKPEVYPFKNQRGASLVFLDPIPGRFISVSYLDDAKSLPGIQDIKIYPTEGDILRELRSGADRVGHIFAFEQTREYAERIAFKAKGLIKINVEKLI